MLAASRWSTYPRRLDLPVRRKLIPPLTLERIADAVVEEGVADRADVDAPAMSSTT